jgi:hypothetical protein
MKAKTWKVITNTGKQADLESRPLEPSDFTGGAAEQATRGAVCRRGSIQENQRHTGPRRRGQPTTVGRWPIVGLYPAHGHGKPSGRRRIFDSPKHANKLESGAILDSGLYRFR